MIRTGYNDVRRPQLVMIVAAFISIVTFFNLRFSSRVGAVLGVRNRDAMNEPPAHQPQHAALVEPTLDETNNSKQTVMTQVDVAALLANYTVPKGINPKDSIAPKAIQLFDTENPGIRKRHECIVKIRELAHHLLDPHIQTYSQSQRSVLIVDPAFHPNVGDHMIVKGEVSFLAPLGYDDDSLVEYCGYAQSGQFAETKCGDLFKKDNIGNTAALWHGGGNWYVNHYQNAYAFHVLYEIR